MEPSLAISIEPAAEANGHSVVTVSVGETVIATHAFDLGDSTAMDSFIAIVVGQVSIDEEDLRAAILQAEEIAKQKPGISKAAAAAEKRLDEALGSGGPAAVFRDRKLLDMLAELSVLEADQYAALREKLRDGRVKMREYDRVMRPLIEDVIKEQPAILARGESGGFYESDGQLCRTKLEPSAPKTVPLCNFVAKIVKVVIRDDGQQRRTYYVIAGSLKTGKPLPTVDVAAEEFHDLKWIAKYWGADAIVWPGEHRALPSAIQALSQGDKEVETIFTHTGWRKFDSGWAYLHAGGAIGLPKDHPKVAVELQSCLSGYSLPDPIDNNDVIEAVRASLRILDLTALHVTTPLLAAVYRAVFGGVDFGLHYVGPTGVFKSELSALGVQHSGAGMDARHLPGNWSSTANALEATANALKDELFPIDDFAPSGSANDVNHLNQKSERVVRAQGNNAGRQRMSANGDMKPTKSPRCLVLSTGEETPRGQSIRSRLLVVDVEPGIDKEKLSACQRDAAAGLYAQAKSNFLAWIAPQYEKIESYMPTTIARYRTDATSGKLHARTPGIVASLTFGLRMFLKFALDIGAINKEEWHRLREQCWIALLKAADTQAAKQATAEPAQHFMRLLAAVITAQRAHITNVDGTSPDSPARWGWRKNIVRSSVGPYEEWQPVGRRIGWLDGDDLYIEPEEAYSQVSRLANEQNDSFVISSTTLHKRLHEKGFLRSTEEKRGTLIVRKTFDSARVGVLHFQASIFNGEDDDQVVNDQSEQATAIEDVAPLAEATAIEQPPASFADCEWFGDHNDPSLLTVQDDKVFCPECREIVCREPHAMYFEVRRIQDEKKQVAILQAN